MPSYLLALLAALAACLLVHLCHQAFLAFQSAEWPLREGRVVASSVHDVGASDTGPEYALRVTYRYAVDGVEYEGRRVHFGSSFLLSRLSFASRARAAVASERFRPGAPIRVHVHPTRRELSTLLPGSGWELYAAILALSGLLAYLFILVIRAL